MEKCLLWDLDPSPSLGDTGKKRKPWKAMMDSGRDPREGIFQSLGLIVSWLLAVAHSQNQKQWLHRFMAASFSLDVLQTLNHSYFYYKPHFISNTVI